MTRLFVRFYAGVIAVLVAAWYIHGEISDRQFGSEIPRVAEGAHQGGMRLLARELNGARPQDRPQIVNRFQGRARLQLVLDPIADLPQAVRSRLEQGEVVFHEGRVCTLLDNGTTVVKLGGFPRYTHIERALRGGVQLAVDEVSEAAPEERTGVSRQLTSEFGYPVELVQLGELPSWVQERASHNEDVMFYVLNDVGNVAAPLADRSAFLHFGPLPSFEGAERRTLATTTAVVLVLTGLAIAVLLRPVARQLRHVEQAASSIAEGDLTARVDLDRVSSARPLGEAFNHMADRTETLLRTQRELLQAVSHELRTPLSRIRFAIDLIDSATTEQERKERLESLETASEELNELVGELLNYVRLESAEPPLAREEIAVGDALQAIIDRHVALHPDVEFELFDETATHNQPAVHADSVAFHRALGNLLSNAGRFATKHVSISAACSDGKITIDVDDDGPGIPEPDRDRVLQPFARLEDSGNGHGVGLGLSIVNRLVTQHGGELFVLSSPKGGCRRRTVWPAASDTSV